MTTRPVLVLGVDRSGTSAAARLVHLWGGYGGEPELIERADCCNPHGYWEYQPMVQFLFRLATASGVEYWDRVFESRLRELASEATHRVRAIRLVERMETGAAGSLWFWKEPFLGLTLPFWRSLLVRPAYVITVRHPVDAATSWSKFVVPERLRKRVNLEAAALLRWHHFMWTLWFQTRGADRIFISYEDMLADPVGQSRRLCLFLDRVARTSDETRATLEARVARMAKGIDTRLQHERKGVEQGKLAGVSAETANFYSQLRRAATGGSANVTEELAIPRADWREVVGKAERVGREIAQIAEQVTWLPRLRRMVGALLTAGRSRHWDGLSR